MMQTRAASMYQNKGMSLSRLELLPNELLQRITRYAAALPTDTDSQTGLPFAGALAIPVLRLAATSRILRRSTLNSNFWRYTEWATEVSDETHAAPRRLPVYWHNQHSSHECPKSHKSSVVPKIQLPKEYHSLIQNLVITSEIYWFYGPAEAFVLPGQLSQFTNVRHVTLHAYGLQLYGMKPDIPEAPDTIKARKLVQGLLTKMPNIKGICLDRITLGSKRENSNHPGYVPRIYWMRFRKYFKKAIEEYDEALRHEIDQQLASHRLLKLQQGLAPPSMVPSDH